jgi:nucleoside 2-deoxyribosyltransferase
VQTARREGSDLIHHTIINQLIEAEMVIADLTDHNPNVLFELGIRIAQEKPVALIKSGDTKEIFDVDNLMRVFKYDRNLWRTTIETDLVKLTDHIKGGWENRDSFPSYMKILTAPHQLSDAKT